MYFDALEAEKLIDEKSQMTPVQDRDLDFSDSSSDNKGGKDSSDSDDDVQLINGETSSFVVPGHIATVIRHHSSPTPSPSPPSHVDAVAPIPLLRPICAIT
ncbi:hypothetical protein BT96DRAFT_1010442 [Gymnopus androsaceus JB14]|uniref:Uncharacterized protein n=1 Tax=Gymnopus androsaceus JB14 TaxID=1447944 RepID=A0A6A4GAN7_9AGAR|nr:hypothetical protein BT96DRAFT_1010442 [Gymnopus androsaceus JB14]